MSSIPTLVRNHARTAIVILSLSILCTAVAAQDKPVELWVDSVFAFPGQQNVEIPVYLKNNLDSVISFKFWYYLEQPDLIEFAGSPDPLIVTEGTLMENWSHATNSLGEQGYDAVVIGSVSPSIPPYNGMLEPQPGDIPLFKLLANVYDIPDTTTDTVVTIFMFDSFLDYFQILDNHGELIGVKYDTVPDTSFFICMEWEGDICVWWERVIVPPYDSMYIEDIQVSSIDTEYVDIKDGYLTVLLCGDIVPDKVVNIIDIVGFIEYKFKDGAEPQYMASADVNHDNLVNVLDIVYLIEYKFSGGPAPSCY